jgi:hypothetical protein
MADYCCSEQSSGDEESSIVASEDTTDSGEETHPGIILGYQFEPVADSSAGDESMETSDAEDSDGDEDAHGFLEWRTSQLGILFEFSEHFLISAVSVLIVIWVYLVFIYISFVQQWFLGCYFARYFYCIP